MVLWEGNIIQSVFISWVSNLVPKSKFTCNFLALKFKTLDLEPELKMHIFYCLTFTYT